MPKKRESDGHVPKTFSTYNGFSTSHKYLYSSIATSPSSTPKTTKTTLIRRMCFYPQLQFLTFIRSERQPHFQYFPKRTHH